MTMKTVPEGIRPYERVEEYGAAILNDAELLAVLLQSGTRKKTALELATELLSRFGSLIDIGSSSSSELRRTGGIGRVKSIRLQAAFELGRRIARGQHKGKVAIGDFDLLGDMLIAEMKGLRQEVFRVLFFDKKWNYISDSKITVGTVDRTIVHPREVFYSAIQHLASVVVLAHNHPTGDCTPSKADYEVTERLVQAGRIVGIEVKDHMVIGDGTYYSMAGHGDMRKILDRIVNEGSKDYGT